MNASGSAAMEVRGNRGLIKLVVMDPSADILIPASMGVPTEVDPGWN